MRYWRAKVVLLAFVMFAMPTPGAASASQWFSVRRDPLFADVRAQLQVLSDEDGRTPDNRFCVVGERVDGGKQAYVHWLTRNRLILWEPQQGNPRAIAGSRRNLDLGRDVVTGNDVAGSTYMLTRASANRIIRACQKAGTRYRLTRKAAAHD